MAYPFSEGNVLGGWQGLMGRKKRPWQSYIMSPGAKASMTQGTQAAMAGKKGLGINDWMDAFSELKTFTPKFGSASARGVGSNPLAKFSPMPGLNPNYDWSYGGLDFDPLKRQKKMMGSLV